jgi:CRISPR-associated DxTHG motif protein
MLTLQAIQGIQFVFNVSFFFFRIELGTKTHGFRYFEVFLGNAVKAYCDWVVNFRTSLISILAVEPICQYNAKAC